MAIVKILQVSDIHQEGDGFAKYEQLKRIANEQKVDLVALLGDFFYQQDMEFAAPAIEALQKKIGLAEEDIRYVQAYMTVKQIGGVDLIKRAISAGHEQSADLEKLVKIYESSADPDATAQRILSLVRQAEDAENKIGKDVLKQAGKRYQKLDEILAGFDMPILAVRGNWEVDTVYNMKNVRWLEKEGRIVYKGLSFAGAPNWFERLANLPSACYEKAESDVFHPQAIAELIQQYGTEEEFKAYIEKAKAGDIYAVPDSIKPHLKVYQRLKGAKADVLLTHKGPGPLAVEGDKSAGSGIGLELALKEMNPSIVLGGHLHSPLLDDSAGYQGIRAGSKYVFINHVDTDLKKVVGIDIYEWQGEELVHKGYQDLTRVAEQAAPEAA